MSDGQSMISWDKPKREQLRLAYKQAVIRKQDIFTWGGYEFVTDYAKYLLEHLDNVLK